MSHDSAPAPWMLSLASSLTSPSYMSAQAMTLLDDWVLGGSRVSISLTPSLDQRKTPPAPPVVPPVVPPDVVAVSIAPPPVFVTAAVGAGTGVSVIPGTSPSDGVGGTGAVVGVASPPQ